MERHKSGLRGQVTNDMFDLDSDSDSEVLVQLDAPDRAHVTYFTHELSLRGRLRKFFVRNSSTRLGCTFFDLVLKSLICAMYVLRVVMDDIESYECRGSPCYAIKTKNGTETNRHGGINWYVLLWVDRHLAVWLTEVILAFISLTKAVLMVYISTKGHRMEQIMSLTFGLEVICAVPMLSTLAYPPVLKDLFVPVFLNCWLAQRSLQKIYNDLHLTRQKFQTISVTLLQQMIILVANIFCLAFVTICMIQHLQRASPTLKLKMFDSFYFVVVTFSTVGYGDISPDIWLSQLYMVMMICIAFASIPKQIEGLISTYMERQRAGGEYSQHSAERYRHVIVCSSTLAQDTVMDFLTEFYSHPKLEDHSVILLCPQELASGMQVILKDPKWAHRVIYMKGSPLKDIDLTRCRVYQADACFFLAPRPTQDKEKADRHTILRSWAVKDFAPGCKQYIQLFSSVNKIHVKFVEHVVCEDEFKYALLANNCLYPGLSTLVSLLVHTSTGQEGLLAAEPWQQIYGRHSGNEIYHIQLQKSVFFSQYEGEVFPRASADAHHRFGVALLAVLDPESPSPCLQLNPGPLYKLKRTDFCFYMSVTKEEYSEVSPEALKGFPRRQSENIAQIALALQKYHTEQYLPPGNEDEDESVFNTITSLIGTNITHMMHRGGNNNQQKPDKKGTSEDSCTVPDTTASEMTVSAGNSTDNNGTTTAVAVEETPGVADTTRVKNRFTVTAARADPNLQDGSNAADAGIKIDKRKSAGRADDSNNANNIEADCPSSRPLLQSCGEDDSTGLTPCDLSRSKDETQRLFQASRSSSSDTLDNMDHRHTTGRVLQYCTDMGKDKLTIGAPPVTIFTSSRTSCHITTESRNKCCLEWGTDCSHCSYKNARDPRWGRQLIILSAQHACAGIFNFIVPLRSSFIGINGLSPIVLLLEEEPDGIFLDTISQFPLVYFMLGCIKRVDDLLMAGINKASHLVVVNRDCHDDHGGEEILADSDTIVAVQTILRLFPNVYIVTELSQTSNMRFMQFTAHDAPLQKVSKLERRLKETVTTNLNHIFRLPFAAGQVFSASMLDTLLYQTFVKDYLISFVRLLLGIDAEEGSGHLSSIRIKRVTLQKFPTYGDLYEGLCTATGEIPFAIYRTERVDSLTNTSARQKLSKAPESEISQGAKTETNCEKAFTSLNHSQFSSLCRPDQADLGSLIRKRLKSLNFSQEDYSDVRKRPDTLSYIITNPSPKNILRIGDIVYVIQPSSMYAKPSKHKFYSSRPQSVSEDKFYSSRPQSASEDKFYSSRPQSASELSTPAPDYHTLGRPRAHTNFGGSNNNVHHPATTATASSSSSGETTTAIAAGSGTKSVDFKIPDRSGGDKNMTTATAVGDTSHPVPTATTSATLSTDTTHLPQHNYI